MSLSIEQDSKYLGKNRWQWSVWLEGDPEELDVIDHVIYILHSTFLDPVRTIDSRSTKFKLEASSWGELYASREGGAKRRTRDSSAP